MTPTPGSLPIFQTPQIVIDLTNASDSDSDDSIPPSHDGLPSYNYLASQGTIARPGASGANHSQHLPRRVIATKKHPLSPATMNIGTREKRRKLAHTVEQPLQQPALPSNPLGSQSILPPHRAPSSQSVAASLNKRTIITGESRAEASHGVLPRVSTAGRIQKPQTTDATNYTNAIKNTVIPVVRTALSNHYRDALSKEKRTKLVGLVNIKPPNQNLTDDVIMKITSQLVMTTDFKLNVLEGGTLSKDYIHHLTKRAEDLVKESSIRDGSLSTSPRSSSEEDVFEAPTEGRPRNQQSQPSRIHSISPPTSFSNTDLADGNSPPDASLVEPTVVEMHPEIRQTRSTRAVVQSYDLVRRRRARKSRANEEANEHSGVSDFDDFYGQTQNENAVQSRLLDNSRNGSPYAAVSKEVPVEAHKQPQKLLPKSQPIVSHPAKTHNKNHRRKPVPDKSHGSIVEHKHSVVESQDSLDQKPRIPKFLLTSFLRQRDTDGMSPSRVRRGQSSFKTMSTNYLEDSLVRLSEWTDCSGDIASISWTSEDTFVCGALAHYDPHNQQYNKPGNLLLGSISRDTLRAFADHRIVRPRVAVTENAENASEAMRRSQAPWLYTSVVSTAHSEVTGYNNVRGYLEPIGYQQARGFTFTASFDKTVKVWSISDTTTMDLRGTWSHEGNVNFVVTSPHHSYVATAAEISRDAVRIYNFDETNIPRSSYNSYGGNKASQQAGEPLKHDAWAYQPATIQWGRAFQVRNLLLVGYSPRSDTGFDVDIPDDKKNTGELCVWNAETGDRLGIFGAHTQNVFEVLWHPTLPIFIAATSPAGNFDGEKTKTQVRLFCLNESGTFMIIKSLDCPALDVNELTIWPNSDLKCYVTASCTDGNTYVWDTAQSDEAIHILEHGESLDNPAHDLPLELGDSGVKFAAWGQSPERFYTGSSDGKVKCWNIKAPTQKAFVRTVLSISGGISSGVFSKDFSKLLVGDATGKVYLLGINDKDLEDNDDCPPVQPQQQSNRHLLQRGGILPSAVRRPKIIIPHPEPEPPSGYDADAVQNSEESIDQISHRFLANGQLQFYRGPSMGVYQGPNYAETGLFRADAHVDNDPSQELIPEYLSKQQHQISREEEVFEVSQLPRLTSSNLQAHLRNTATGLDDLDISKLTLETKQMLRKDGVELHWERHLLDYVPRSSRPSNMVFASHVYPLEEDGSSHDGCSHDGCNHDLRSMEQLVDDQNLHNAFGAEILTDGELQYSENGNSDFTNVHERSENEDDSDEGREVFRAK